MDCWKHNPNRVAHICTSCCPVPSNTSLLQRHQGEAVFISRTPLRGSVTCVTSAARTAVRRYQLAPGRCFFSRSVGSPTFWFTAQRLSGQEAANKEKPTHCGRQTLLLAGWKPTPPSTAPRCSESSRLNANGGHLFGPRAAPNQGDGRKAAE